ncbi:MAG TPA: hypothetical protein VD837_04860 [Terriglobales bacterium]|nr:hypothetical protein [Terriglobales bacterium]
MRARALVGILLFVLFVSGAAAWGDEPQQESNAQPQQQSYAQPAHSNPQKSNAQTYDLFQTATGDRVFVVSSENARDATRSFTMPKSDSTLAHLSAEQVKQLLRKSSGNCYKMRTYIVERVDNSDSTRPAGYQTCLAANQVQFKNAVPEP